MLFLASLAITNLGPQCLTPTDEYAVEVVIPNYDARQIAKIVDRYQNTFYKATEQDPQLIALYSETTNPQGLSVRVQVPTEAVTVRQPSYKIVSNSVGLTKKTPLRTYLGWTVSCGEVSCVFTKPRYTLQGELTIPEATLEINRELEACTPQCSGHCFSTGVESLCLNATIESEIEPLLRLVNISRNFDQFFQSYRVVNPEGVALVDIAPRIATMANLGEVLRTELIFLRDQQTIEVSDEDIAEITQLALRGHAGNNYRIVYDTNSSQWRYYNQITDAVLTSTPDCRAIFLTDEAPVTEETNLYYVIPITLTVTAIILFGALIVIARALQKHHKKHPGEKSLKTHTNFEL